jgi:hypothetical protein
MILLVPQLLGSLYFDGALRVPVNGRVDIAGDVQHLAPLFRAGCTLEDGTVPALPSTDARGNFDDDQQERMRACIQLTARAPMRIW